MDRRQDVIPIVPGKAPFFFSSVKFNWYPRLKPGISQGYQQTSGEIHILKDDGWVSCPGKNFVSRTKGEKKLTGITY